MGRVIAPGHENLAFAIINSIFPDSIAMFRFVRKLNGLVFVN